MVMDGYRWLWMVLDGYGLSKSMSLVAMLAILWYKKNNNQMHLDHWCPPLLLACTVRMNQQGDAVFWKVCQQIRDKGKQEGFGRSPQDSHPRKVDEEDNDMIIRQRSQFLSHRPDPWTNLWHQRGFGFPNFPPKDRHSGLQESVHHRPCTLVAVLSHFWQCIKSHVIAPQNHVGLILMLV